MAYEKDPNQIGSLWCKVSSKGRPYMSGIINGENVVIFENKKTALNQPDYKVLKSKPRESKDEPQEPPPFV